MASGTRVIVPSPLVQPVAPQAKKRASGWLRRPVLLLAVIVAFCIPMARIVFGTETSNINVIICGLLLVLTVCGYTQRPPYFWLWILGGLMVPLGSLWSGVNSSATSSLIVGALMGIMFILLPGVITRMLADTPQALRWVSASFLVSQTISGLAGLLQLAGISVLGYGTVFGRAVGLAGHANALGLMAGIGLAIAASVVMTRSPLLRTVLIFTMAVNGVALIGTGSLSAMMAVLLAALFAVFASRKFFRLLIGGVLAAAVLIPIYLFAAGGEDVLFSSVVYRIGVVTGESGGGGAASLDIREGTYTWALQWISESPFVGVGMDPMNSTTFDGKTVVHNYLLRGWYQGGILVALWLMLLTATAVFSILLGSLRKKRAFWPASVVLLILIFAATAAFLNQAMYWLPLIFAMIVAARMLRADPGSGEPPAEAPSTASQSRKK